jgi:hypothetical protein
LITIFGTVRREKGGLFLISEMDPKLVKALARVESEEPKQHQHYFVEVEVLYSVCAAWDRVHKWLCLPDQSAIGDTHAPDKSLDVFDALLVRLCSEDDLGSPGSLASARPAISSEGSQLRVDDDGLIKSIQWLAAAQGLRVTRVSNEFIPPKWV